MGGKGSGCKPIYHDKYHTNQRKYQLKYDKTIATIRKEIGCSLKVARRIHHKRRVFRMLKQIEEEEREEKRLTDIEIGIANTEIRRAWKESSLYTREIVTIMNEENCSIPEAQEIQRERAALRKLEKNKNKKVREK